jgi:phage baseplate assembly protein V
MSEGNTSARVRGMITRAVTGTANDAPRMQTIQLALFAEQDADDIEHFQPYGITSVPHAGAEGIALAIGGSTGHTVVVNVDDRRYRLKGLEAGEVALYDDLGHTVHLTRAGIVIKGGGHPVVITDTPLVRMESDLHVTGNITGDGDLAIEGGMAGGGGLNVVGDIEATGGDVKADNISLKTHKTSAVQPGAGLSGLPVP